MKSGFNATPRSLRYLDHEHRIFNRAIPDISVVLRETTLTISASIETGSSVGPEIVRVVSLCTTEILQIIQNLTKMV